MFHNSQPNNDVHEWKREPETGWKITMSPYYCGGIVYKLNSQNSEFQKIVIIFSVGDDFEINFQIPKDPLLFEKCLEKFHYAYDSLQKEFKNYNILKIDFNQLTELLVHLHENKYISQQLLHDIKLAISPENSDLIKLKKAKEIHLQMPMMMFSSPEAHQDSLDKNLYDYVCNINMKLYSMKANDISDRLLTIENLLKINANPNRTTSYKTPLMGLIINQPCNNNTKQIAKLLVQYGAQLDATDIQGNTVLHHAALSQNKLWVAFLLEVGADATSTNECGNTPKQVYLNHCKSDNLIADAEIENMLAITEISIRSKL